MWGREQCAHTRRQSVRDALGNDKHEPFAKSKKAQAGDGLRSSRSRIEGEMVFGSEADCVARVFRSPSKPRLRSSTSRYSTHASYNE